MAEYIEFSYDEAKVNDIVENLETISGYVKDNNISNLIEQLKKKTGWDRVPDISNNLSVIEKYKSKVIVYGTFIHKGGFGGNIYKSNNAVVTLSNNSGTIKWLDRINYLNIDLSSILQLMSAFDLGGTVSDKTTAATINTL